MEKVMLKPRKAIDGTRCLTNQERGAYWDLINLMYLMGGPVHDDDRYLAGHCALHLAAYKRVRKSLIEKGKLHPLDGGKIIANHVEVELNMVESMLELRRKSGQSGGKASAKSRSKSKENNGLDKANGSTPAKPPSSPSPSPSPPSKEGIDSKESIDHFFETEFWPTYPKRVGKGDALKALKAAAKRSSPGEIIVGLRRACDHWRSVGTEPQFIPNPGTWLRADRWKDEQPACGPPKPFEVVNGGGGTVFDRIRRKFEDEENDYRLL